MADAVQGPRFHHNAVSFGGDNAPEPLTPGALMRDVRGLAVGFPDRMYKTQRCREAAEHVAEQMEAAGLKPLNGSWFQEIPMPKRQEWEEGSVSAIRRGPVQQRPADMPP